MERKYEQYYSEAQIKKKEVELENKLSRNVETSQRWYELILEIMAKLSLGVDFLIGDIGMSKPTAYKFIRSEWDPISNIQPQKQFIWRFRLSVLLADSAAKAIRMLAMSGIVLNGVNSKRDRAALHIIQSLHYPADIGEKWEDVYLYNYMVLERLIKKAEMTKEIEPGELGGIK